LNWPECGLIYKNLRGLFAKRAGRGAGGRLAGHVARWGWSVHGGGLWTGAGHGSTGSTVDRSRKTGERTAQGAGRGGGAMAVAGELAVGELQGKAGCSEGTVA